MSRGRIVKLRLPGTPPSLGQIEAWCEQRREAAPWQARIAALLRDHERPTGPVAVTATISLSFDDRRRRSADDLRAIPARALADALVAAGWILDRADLTIVGPSLRAAKRRRTTITLTVVDEATP